MGAVDALLAEVAPELERQIRPQLAGPFGGVVRAYLPQSWVFTTDQGTATLTVAKDGAVAAVAGAVPGPDVTVEIGHARLVVALRTRDRSQVPPGVTKVTPHSERGRTAFQFVRSRLGI